MKTATKKGITTSEAQEKMIDIYNNNQIKQSPHYKFDYGQRLIKWGLAEWESHRNAFITGRDNPRGCKTYGK